MNCPHCGSPVEAGAQFCGSCGQPLTAAPQPQAAQPAQPTTPTPQPQPAAPVVVAPAQPSVVVPAAPVAPMQPQPAAVPGTVPAQPVYGGPAVAVAAPAAPAVPVAAHSHPGETRAIIGLIVAILSVPGAIIPILGLVLAITGLVLGSLSIRFKRVLAILALVFAGLGLVLSILAWAYNVQHRDGKTPAISSAAKHYTTDCYDIAASASLHATHDVHDCTFTASDKATVSLSRIAYHIEGQYQSGATADNFESGAKKIASLLADEISTSARQYTLDSDTATTFQGEPAHQYELSADDGAHDSVLLVFHTAPNGDNLFEIDDATTAGTAVSLSDIESNLVWK